MEKQIPQSMRDMIDLLNKATKAYDEGNPIMSDEAWDKIYFQLEKMEDRLHIVAPDSPTHKINYEVVNGLEKVEHNHPMLSLKKTKEISDVISFGQDKWMICMEKLDGLTCSLKYVDGKLVSAETRGNGLVGENILHNIYHVKGVPHKIDFMGEFVIDGEVICTYDDFEPWSDTYKNPRNFASGSIRLLDAKECAKRNLTFVAWDCIDGLNDINRLDYKLKTLKLYGFNTVSYNLIKTTSENLVTEVIEMVKGYATEEKYPIDGVVFKYNDCAYYQSLGATDHHFRGGLAYKFYDETYPTVLRDIEWSMGRTGTLTPIAVFDPVDIDGSTVERASLHNLTVMKNTLHSMAGWQGQKIEVFKANMIIPQIASAEEDDGTTKFRRMIPPFCPICKSILGRKKDNESEFLICENPACEGKFVNKLDHFCGKKGLDIKGLSVATLNKLIDWGWITNLNDIYKLKEYREEWIQKEGFGIKSVDNILAAIDLTRSVATPQAFITAIGIPLIGSVQAKELCKVFYNWPEFRKAVKENFDFSELPGFGTVKRDAILNFDYTEADEVAKNIISIYLVGVESKNDAVPQTCAGLTFVVTGSLGFYKNRNELTKDIELMGGKVVGSISKNTKYLINNDTASESSKNVAAKRLGIPIISEQEFIAKFVKK